MTVFAEILPLNGQTCKKTSNLLHIFASHKINILVPAFSNENDFPSFNPCINSRGRHFKKGFQLEHSAMQRHGIEPVGAATYNY